MPGIVLHSVGRNIRRLTMTVRNSGLNLMSALGGVVQIIDAAQVRLIRDYRIRLDNDAQVAELLDLCARQTAVSALVIEVLACFGEETQWVGLNAAATIWRIFESAAEEPVPPVSRKILQERYDQMINLLLSAEDLDPRFAERINLVRYVRQPHVMQTVERHCLNYGTGRFGSRIADDAINPVMALISAIVDSMHFCIEGARFQTESVSEIGSISSRTH